MKKLKKKKRASKYEKKLAVTGTFADIIRAAVKDMDEPKGKK